MKASGVEVRHGFTHAQERRARYGADLLRPQHGHVDQFDIPHASTWAGIPPLAERFPNKSSDGPPAARSAAAPVTSLYRNNSIKKKKAALMDELRVNVENVIRLVGIDQCGLATFTTRRNCTMEEFQHLWHSYVNNVLRPRFGNAITVIEAQMRGAPHAHCFIYVGKDVRTGARWIKRGKRWMLARYSGSPALREIQAFLYETWNRYCRRQHGTSNEVMGTAHFLPTRQNAESIAVYLAKYVVKGIEHRPPEWENKSLVRYIDPRKRFRMVYRRRARCTAFAVEARAKLREFCCWRLGPQYTEKWIADGKCPLDLLREHLGSDWYWKNRDKIHSMPVPERIAPGFTVPERHTTSPLLEIGAYRTFKGGWIKTKDCKLPPTASWYTAPLGNSEDNGEPF